MAKNWWEISAVSLLILALAILSTYPLILYFDTALPYASFGGPMAWNRSGDQMQLLYWFWLVKENLMGTIVPFNSNPFEFNMVIPHDSSGMNTIPLALLYVLFSQFGDIAAYNCTIFSSYVLAGVFMYLLVRLYSSSRVGALLAAIIFTFAPSRLNGFTAGHAYGILFFCYPLILFFLEKGIRSKKIRYGLFSGIGLIFLAMVEPHLIYYICVFLGCYIPVRVLSLFSVDQVDVFPNKPQGVFSWSTRFSLLLIWGSGLAAVIYAKALFRCRDQEQFFDQFFWWVVCVYPLVPVFISLCYTAVYQRLSTLNFRESLAIEAGSMLPLFSFVPLAGLLCNISKPVDTGILVTASLVAVIGTKLWFLRHLLPSMLNVLARGIWARKREIFPIFPLIFSMGGIVYWIASSKVEKIASTIAGEGRTLGDVGLFSARLSDLLLPTSNVYIGILPAVFGGALLLVLLWSTAFGKQEKKFVGESDFLCLFYVVVAFCCMILALGLAFGSSSLYILFYHYFPFFNYPRVSDRIITLVLFALAVVVGFVVKSIQSRCRGRLSLLTVTLLFFAAAGLQLKDYNIDKSMGISILDRGQDIYTYVKDNIGDDLLLEIPLWPGDSHQSSLYQHYIMLDRVKRVNGCSPLVLKEYIDTVFEPLASINRGRLDRKQYELLQHLGVKFITVHDNRDIFLEKVSPFAPLTTVRRLKNSPYLEFVDIDNTMYFKTFEKKNNHLYLFRVKDAISIDEGTESAWYDMPNFYDVNRRLRHQIGTIVKDKESGKSVFQATVGKDKPGFLVYGPYDMYAPGDFRCYFTIAADGSADENVARLEVVRVVGEETTVLAQSEVKVLDGETSYKKMYLDFSIPKNTKLEFRVFYYGKGLVRVEKIVVHKIAHDTPLFLLEAESMVGNTGQLVFVEGASQGKVVEAIVGKSKKGDLVYGPNRIYPKGRYKVLFFLRSMDMGKQENNQVAAVLSVTDGQNSRSFARRKVIATGLNDTAFTGVEVEFELSRDEELGFNVQFAGTISLQLDRIEIVRK